MHSPETSIPWRRRTDLESRAYGAAWILKDPVAQRHFQLSREAYFVWQQLTGEVTPGVVCQRFATQYAPRKLSLEQLRQFLSQLIQQGLVWGDASGVGELVERRRKRVSTLGTWSKLAGILAFRLRGIDPDRGLAALARYCGWIFSPIALALGAVFLCSALLLAIVQWPEFSRRLPEEMAHWQVTDVLSFAIVLAVLKISHEFGHGIACKRFGGEVRELGVLFLVFTPCLYCNVSDVWMMPSRWRRFVVSAAGIWIETLIASAALWLWWLSDPGWFHALCLQVVFLAGLSTLAFNLNPLLRYDGYFLLSDLWGIPNLQQRASQELSRRIRGMAGLVCEPAAGDFSARTLRWLAIYAAAAVVYRVWMVFIIVWVLDQWLEPQGLRLLSQIISSTAIVALLLGPAAALWSSLKDPQSRRSWQFERPYRLIAVALLGSLLLTWPWPSHLVSPVVLLPKDARGVFATMDGELEQIIPPGSRVEAGTVIAVLKNPQLERELKRLSGEVERAQQSLENLQRRQILDARVRWQIPAAEQHLQDVTMQRDQRARDAERLKIHASRAGTLWPIPATSRHESRERLTNWTGSLFDAHNLGCWVAAGTQIGWIGDDDRLEALAILSQTEAARVHPGQPAVVVVECRRDRKLGGPVDAISNMRMQTLTPDLAQRLKMPQVSQGHDHRLVGTWYQMRIPLKDSPGPAVALGQGIASVRVASESLLGRTSRWLKETFSLMR